MYILLHFQTNLCQSSSPSSQCLRCRKRCLLTMDLVQRKTHKLLVSTSSLNHLGGTIHTHTSLSCMCMYAHTHTHFRDFMKFMEKDRHGLESNVLRFVARLDTTRPIDLDRRFIVSYHLSDDTITLFEPFQRNSGV